MKIFRILSVLVTIALAVSLFYSWFMTFVVGQYYMSATIFLTVLYGIVYPIIVVYSAVCVIRWLIDD